MQHDPLRWGAAPPVPPPRDPAGIHNIVQEHRRRSSATELLDNDDMSSDSSSPPDASKRRSSYENVRTEDDQGFYPNKPPPALAARRSREHRSTPSPLHVRASPTCGGSRRASPVSGRQDSWSDANADEASAEPVRRRPSSSCCRSTRGHRGSMPPVDCLGPPWGHRSPCIPCCAPSPIPSYWCGASQNWTHYIHSNNEMAFECEDPEQKVCQLEIEKHQLTLQVNILSDQVEAQNERIMELEKSLSQNKEQLQNCEMLLRKEMSSRSSIESNKLDLMAQISALRLRLANVENLKRDTEERNNKLESELVLMCACLAEKEADLANFRSKLIHNGIDMPIYDNNSEIEKLKEALSSVMAAYDQKEKKLQEMSTSLNRYKKLHELVLSNSSRKNNEFHSQKLPSVEEHFFTTLDNLTACDSDKIPEISFNYNLIEKPPPAPRQLLQSSISNEDRSQSALGDMTRLSPLFTPIRGESPFSTTNSLKYNSSENVHPPTPQKTPPTKRHYSTLPRAHQTDILMKYTKSPSGASSVATGQTSHSFHNLHHASVDASRAKPPSGSSFGKGFLKLRLGKRSCSAPELVPEKIDETVVTPLNKEPNYKRTSSPLVMHPPKEKSKGFRKIFGKVKRSGSENLNSSAAELKRGGIRATAGPRLGWSEDQKVQSFNLKTDIPFAEWDSNMICDWLLTLGLSMYLPNCKKWVKSGDQLLKATTEDFEKALNIKNPLHRKKLLLAINGTKEQTGEVVEPAGKIDHQWVIRWLDDIGLPQYKDAFYDARIDGRMLHHLTLEDLSHLNVTNMLHHISIKTGIQVLRENNFEPHCLKRRSLPEDENTPSGVSKWTNHRVMEWLRNVDLSEYAPNLRGSGVHGGLMLYEPRFNADLMATILNIPPNKTLLRRHLTTQFKQLVGPDIIQKKREWETQPSYLPLSPNAKVKPLKRSPFSLMKRKNKNEFDLEDYVCPMNFSEKLLGNSSLLSNNQNRTEEEKFLMKEMVLKNDTGFESMPASNV